MHSFKIIVTDALTIVVWWTIVF